MVASVWPPTRSAQSAQPLDTTNGRKVRGSFALHNSALTRQHKSDFRFSTSQSTCCPPTARTEGRMNSEHDTLTRGALCTPRSRTTSAAWWPNSPVGHQPVTRIYQATTSPSEEPQPRRDRAAPQRTACHLISQLGALPGTRGPWFTLIAGRLRGAWSRRAAWPSSGPGPGRQRRGAR